MTEQLIKRDGEEITTLNEMYAGVIICSRGYIMTEPWCYWFPCRDADGGIPEHDFVLRNSIKKQKY